MTAITLPQTYQHWLQATSVGTGKVRALEANLPPIDDAAKAFFAAYGKLATRKQGALEAGERSRQAHCCQRHLVSLQRLVLTAPPANVARRRQVESVCQLLSEAHTDGLQQQIDDAESLLGRVKKNADAQHMAEEAKLRAQRRSAVEARIKRAGNLHTRLPRLARMVP